MPAIFLISQCKPMINDSINYNYNGLHWDIRKIAGILKIPLLDSTTGGSWRTISMYNNTSVLRTGLDSSHLTAKMPNVVGLGLKDAVYLLENLGLKVIASGRGKVIFNL